MSLYKKWWYGLVLLLVIVTGTRSEQYTVITTANSKEGSLAWAIEQCQLNSGKDTIEFAIPYSDPNFDSNTGTWTLLPSKALPAFTDDGTFVDGLSQARNIGESNADGLLICINGEKQNASSPCFKIHSAFNHILGFCIHSYKQHSILISGSQAHNNRISGCYVGVDQDGRLSKPGSVNGIVLEKGSHNNMIGGLYTLHRNIFCSFRNFAIYLKNTSRNKILGNYIGINATADPVGNGTQQSSPFPNSSSGGGIKITGNSKSNIIGSAIENGENVISGNYGDAILIESAGADSNVIQGNIIGLDPLQNQSIPNHGNGVVITCASGDADDRGPGFNKIGGSRGNVIAANLKNGIVIAKAGHHNQISGNLIGMVNGSAAGYANQAYGILLHATGKKDRIEHNTIGPLNRVMSSLYAIPEDTTAAISCKGTGVRHNQIIANQIGITPSGSIISSAPAIRIDKSRDNTIGPDNLICSKDNSAIWIYGPKAAGNPITRNRFHLHNGTALRYAPDSLAPTLPVIDHIAADRIQGTAIADGQVELFAGDAQRIHRFVGSCRADSLGRFVLKATLDTTSYVAMVTNKRGNTSKPTEPFRVYCVIDHFSAEYRESQIRINWETRFEIDNFGFYLQKSTDRLYWQELGFIAGVGTARERRRYSFSDQADEPGTYYYRLRQVNLNGDESLSSPISVAVPEPPSCQLMAPYPNPFNASTQIRFTLLEPDRITVTVLNLKGETVSRLMNEELAPGEHNATWQGQDENGNSVASGVYIIHLQAESGASQSAKIVYSK